MAPFVVTHRIHLTPSHPRYSITRRDPKGIRERRCGLMHLRKVMLAPSHVALSPRRSESRAAHVDAGDVSRAGMSRARLEARVDRLLGKAAICTLLHQNKGSGGDDPFHRDVDVAVAVRESEPAAHAENHRLAQSPIYDVRFWHPSGLPHTTPPRRRIGGGTAFRHPCPGRQCLLRAVCALDHARTMTPGFARHNTQPQCDAARRLEDSVRFAQSALSVQKIEPERSQNQSPKDPTPALPPLAAQGTVAKRGCQYSGRQAHIRFRPPGRLSSPPNNLGSLTVPDPFDGPDFDRGKYVGRGGSQNT